MNFSSFFAEESRDWAKNSPLSTLSTVDSNDLNLRFPFFQLKSIKRRLFLKCSAALAKSLFFNSQLYFQ